MLELLFGIYQKLGGTEIPELSHQWAFDAIEMTGREAESMSRALTPKG